MNRRTRILPPAALVLSLIFGYPLYAQDLYWDEPVILEESNSRFPQALAGDSAMAVVWQEIVHRGNEEGDIYLSCAVGDGTSRFVKNERFAGPYPFTGKDSSIFSFAFLENDRLIIAVSTSDKAVTVLSSDDRGATFSTVSVLATEQTLVAPRLFRLSDGGAILFATQNIGDSLSIAYSRSPDGETWTAFVPLIGDPALRPSFLPHHAVHGGTDYVVFQTLYAGDEKTYQLYMTKSTDAGGTWSVPVGISGFRETVTGKTLTPERFDNQRPFLASAEGRLLLAWERSAERQSKQIYMAELNADGSLKGEPEKITDGAMTCNYPQIVEYRDTPLLVWFDNRRGEDNIFTARKSGVFWNESRLAALGGTSIFPRPVFFRESMFIFWENRTGGSSRIVYLPPDREVPRPVPRAVNFIPGKPASLSSPEIVWQTPDDSSGIAGYSVLWDRDPDSKPGPVVNLLQNDRKKEFAADADGPWFFHIAAQDYAGNWSEPVRMEFVRDATPPGPVALIGPETDERGMAKSNTFTMTWTPPPEKDIAGYSYDLQYLGWDPSQEASPQTVSLKTSPGRLMTRTASQTYKNLDNGLWMFSVRAIDTSGNVGEPAVQYLRLNRYVSVTYIADVRPEINLFGGVKLFIEGRGFSQGGDVSTIVIDRDGTEPYDYVFNEGDGAFKVEDDRRIIGPELDDPENGTYRVGVVHPVRGTYFTRPLLNLETPGTVKFGDYSYTYNPVWTVVARKITGIRPEELAVWGTVALLAVCVMLLSVRMAGIIREGRLYGLEFKALMSGSAVPSALASERVSRMRRKGIGLRAKFAFFTMVLVAAIVLMSAIPLGYYMVDSQGKTLAEGLEKKTSVLLESLAQGARTYLPTKNTLELGLLLQQTAAMEEAVFATITGEAVEGGNFETVWATNDPDIQNKISGGAYSAGNSVLSDSISDRIDALSSEIDASAEAQVSDLVKKLDSLNTEALGYALNTDEESQRKVSELQTVIQSVDSDVNIALGRIANRIGSDPEFRIDRLDGASRSYTFYKPIVYRVRGQNAYYRGLVRLGVTTDEILKEIDASRSSIITITAIIALIAVVIGMIGSLLLASITVIPIKRLVKGVEIIRDTEDKSDLKNHVIDVKSHDELSVLAETVNQMTQGLVKAAVASKDLTVGKEVQKMFIPLERDGSGKKLTTGRELAGKAEFFGYYEGAKGVSGDYFDFTRLDDRYYAIIKCDVAGKGVPAALIMVEVATIFISHFKDWAKNGRNMDLTVLVYRINDLLEERGFKGRFAALTVALFDSKTGDCYICNAGDTLIHVYDGSLGKMVTKELPKAPAAGVFASMLVRMQSPFKQFKLQLKPGDTVFFFTDGLEESKRYFRAEAVAEAVRAGAGPGPDGPRDNRPSTVDNEEFGLERIYAIVKALNERGVFRLEKLHNPEGDEVLEFDFSDCESTAQDMITALVSVEKIFRMYPDPKAGSDRRVQVDRKVDEFLSKHFRQYASYFSHPVATAERTEYSYYSGVAEDDQYDDLTILGIRMDA